MSFDKDYPNRKDHRRPYRGAGQHSRGCRTGGSCGWCQSNRTIQTQKLKLKAKEQETNNE
jgi:hypothetical protein